MSRPEAGLAMMPTVAVGWPTTGWRSAKMKGTVVRAELLVAGQPEPSPILLLADAFEPAD
jgi:hypothetical protein